MFKKKTALALATIIVLSYAPEPHVTFDSYYPETECEYNYEYEEREGTMENPQQLPPKKPQVRNTPKRTRLRCGGCKEKKLEDEPKYRRQRDDPKSREDHLKNTYNPRFTPQKIPTRNR